MGSDGLVDELLKCDGGSGMVYLSAMFSVEQGVAHGCSLSPILFSVFINDL